MCSKRAVRKLPNMVKMTYMIIKMEFSKDYVELIKYCKKIKIKWFASCWDDSVISWKI